MTRTAIITNVPSVTLREVRAYLPSNYTAEYGVTDSGHVIVITGKDEAGWGMDTYVLPRLASGNITATEIGG